MSDDRCPRCFMPSCRAGVPLDRDFMEREGAISLVHHDAIVACREREIGNLRAFFHGARKRLGKIDEMLRNLMEDME